MNKLIVLLIVFSFPMVSFAQECASAEDCLKKGNGSSGKTSFEYFDKALKYAKKEGKNLSPFYLERAKKYFHQYTPDLKEAEKDFKNAIKEDEKNINAYLWLGYMYSHTEGGYKQANDYLTGVLTKFPNNPLVLRERANNHNYYKQNALAATDFEMAYNLMRDDPAQLDVWSRADITMGHANAYMLLKNINIADEHVVKILEDGVKHSPDHAKLLGELALAYYDIGNINKAYELGERASSIDEKTVGSLFAAFRALEAKDARRASSLMWSADRASARLHPVVTYYFSVALWDHCYNVGGNQWRDNKGIIKNRLELTIQYGQGTKYNDLAKSAQDMIAAMN
jgi:Tfp pilus assembly protein PilF